MAVLWVRDGFEKELERSIDSYDDELGDVSGRYGTARDGISGYTDDGDVGDCNVYLKKRRQELQARRDAAAALREKAKTYVTSVVDADRAVANSIHKRSYDFYRQTGIGPQADNVWSLSWYLTKTTAQDFLRDAKGTTKRLVADIKDFYEKNKYVINIVLDVLAVVAAVALFALAGPGLIGILCLIGAAYALSKALYETATDCMALKAHNDGDEAEAEDLSSRTLTGDAVKAGAWLDGKLGTDFFETSVKCVLVGLEVCEFVCVVANFINAAKTCFNLKGLKSLDLRNMTQRSWAQSLVYAKMVNWGPGRFASINNWVKFGLMLTGFKITLDAGSLSETMRSFSHNMDANRTRLQEIKETAKSGKGRYTVLGKDGDKLAKDISNIIMATP